MRQLLLVLALLLAGVPAFAQTTSVSGTITDQGSQAWAFGTVQFTFRPSNSNPTGPYFWNGAAFDSHTTIPASPLALDNTGSFSGVAVPSSNFITPSGSTWTVQVCPAATTPCFLQNLTITGGTANISAQVIPPAVNLNLTVPLLGARAYSDNEVFGALPGTLYFNLTDNRLHVCLQTGFPPCTWFIENGGAGTVTSVSSGNFSPLFNVTVSNPTTAPAFSFAAVSQSANLVYASPNGSAGVATFRALVSGDISGGVVTGITGTLNQILPCCSFQTGNVTLSVPDPFIGTGGVFAAPGFELGFASLARFVSPGTNEISMSNGAGNFHRLDIGPNTASFPALQVNGASLDIELADGSGRTGVRAASITDDGLTSGRCVQAGAAGILTNAAGACATGSFTALQAVKKVGTCTPGSSSSYDACTDTLTWPTAFADTSYMPVCTGVQPSGSGLGASNNFATMLIISSYTTTNVTVITQQERGATNNFTEISCIGVHP